MEIAPAVAVPANESTGSSADSASSSAANSPGLSPGKESSAAPSSAANYDDDEEEEDVCRICRNPADAEHPLRYPCACSGSIKYVHQDCLLQWLNHSNARQCEVLILSLSPSL